MLDNRAQETSGTAMGKAERGEVTRVLYEISRGGGQDSSSRLFGLVYEDFRALAANRRMGESIV